MSYLLEYKGVSKSYNNITVLKDISFNLSEGEILGIIGENGAGKSTLVKIISGALEADSGQIFVNEKEVNFKTPLDAKKYGISTIYQELNLFEEFSVAENLLLGNYPSFFSRILTMLGFINWKIVYEKAKFICEKYGYDINIKNKVKHLSMGEKQIVAIIRALSQNSNVIIMDEPSNSLPENDVKKLFNIMSRIKKQGKSIIYITHNLEEIFKIADRVIVVCDGEITSNELVENIRPNDLVRSMAGKDYKNRYPKLSTRKGSELLRIDKINRGRILKDVSFNIHRGEIVGLTGLVGSGRSSVARAIFGADRIDSGNIYIKGKKVLIKSPTDAVSNGISFIPEDRIKHGIISGESIVNNITIANLKSVEHERIRCMVDKSYENKRVETYANRLAIKRSSISQPVEYLSGGNQQKVLLARWILADTDIILFDEPTKGIDIASRVQIYNIMNELTREEKGILLISSDISEILGMCDRILVMYNGSIVKHLSRYEATKEMIISFASGIN